MNVKLISYTESIDGLSAEEMIVKIARVSNPSNENNLATSNRLIKYLIEHKHWSPFEMVDITFEIYTSRAIASQILRHRSFVFQEFSQRYSSVNKFEPIEFRKQGETNRQSSEEPISNVSLYERLNTYLESAEGFYNELILNQVSRETARMVLPLATQTRIYMKGSLRSWIHYIELRTGLDTQKEHREIAKAIQIELKKLFPNVSIFLQW